MKLAAILITGVLVSGGFGHQTPSVSPLETAVLKAKSTLDEESVLRSAIDKGNLDECSRVFMKAYQTKKQPLFLYGVMRCQYFQLALIPYGQSHIASGHVSADLHADVDLIEQVPSALRGDATALAGYYYWVQLCRESKMPPPNENHGAGNATVNGHTIPITVTKTISDLPKDRRLTDLYKRAKAADEQNPFVLKIGAERERDEGKRYQLAAQALKAGGKNLCPEDLLYSLFTVARSLGRAAEVEEHKRALDQWLAAHARTVWGRVFKLRHPDYS